MFDVQEDTKAVAVRKKLLSEIEKERLRQISLKLGGNTNEFDSRNDANDWVAYIVAYVGRAAPKVARNEKDAPADTSRDRFRGNMIKVAALALSALEACDEGLITELEGKS